MTDQTVSIVATVPAVRAPSKKSLALTIFQTKLTERVQGLFGNNKDFRKAVLESIEQELGVSRASASTMYNAAKTDAEAVDSNVGLGRDPKQVKAPSSGKRGRPTGSKNRVVIVGDIVAVSAIVAEPVAELATADAVA